MSRRLKSASSPKRSNELGTAPEGDVEAARVGWEEFGSALVHSVEGVRGLEERCNDRGSSRSKQKRPGRGRTGWRDWQQRSSPGKFAAVQTGDIASLSGNSLDRVQNVSEFMDELGCQRVKRHGV